MASDWPVLEHSTLRPLSDNLWWADGALPKGPLRRSCTVLRDSTGGLVVHSAICFGPETQAQLDALGPVRTIVVPSGMHRLDAPHWAARYPDAQVLCPSGAHDKVAQVVSVDGDLDGLSDPAVSVERVAGLADRERVLRVTSDDGVSLVFTDLLFNLAHTGGLGGWMLRLLGSSGGPRVTPLARRMLVEDRTAVRADLERLAALDGLTRLVPGHGAVVDTDAPAVLRAVAAGL